MPKNSLENKSEKLRYRLLTGTDNREFCEKVSAALEDGYELYGSPSCSVDGEKTLVAQAVILKEKP